MKNAKGTGSDDIPAEILKALGRIGKHELFEICLGIYKKGSPAKRFHGIRCHSSKKYKGSSNVWISERSRAAR